MACYLCGDSAIELVQEGVRYNNEIKVFKCITCGLIFIDNYNINYAENEMLKIDASDDMDYADTNRRFNNYKWWLNNAKLLDFGCGKGSFLAKIKESKIPCNLSAFEPNKTHATSLVNDYSLYVNIETLPNNHFNIITMFHVVEHLDDPVSILNTLFDKLYDNGRLIIELPNHDDALNILYQSEAYKKFIYVPYHKFYFNEDTLRLLAEETLFKTEYIKTEQRYELSNHLFWLAKQSPGGHNLWPFLNSKEYKKQLEIMRLGDTITMVLKK